MGVPLRAAQADFNPRSPWGERPERLRAKLRTYDFNPRSPWGERPARLMMLAICSAISIHAPRGGSDSKFIKINSKYINFNPRSPWGERPSSSRETLGLPEFQSTLPVGGATPDIPFYAVSAGISIHAPRGGSDYITKDSELCGADFNPRSPWGERPIFVLTGCSHFGFQSTLPVGGATTAANTITFTCFISIHAPRGGSDGDADSPIL